MTDFLYRLVSAIATEEGFFAAGSLPARLNNPGDLRAAPWLKHPAIQHGFWHADSIEEGIAGAYHQVALDVARVDDATGKGWSLRKFIYTYAPPADNNRTEQYIANVARMAGIDPAQPMWTYLEIARLA